MLVNVREEMSNASKAYDKKLEILVKLIAFSLSYFMVKHNNLECLQIYCHPSLNLIVFHLS